MNPNSLEYLRYMIDQLFPPGTFLLVFMIPVAIALGIRLARYIVKSMAQVVIEPVTTFDAMPFLEDEKLKREMPLDSSEWQQPVSFFDPPDTEPDYVVGFGDDGELVYASEKPKRKNDEVDQ